MATHIHLKKGDVGKYVLLPGDPKRAIYIGEKFINGKIIQDNRGLVTVTGEYKGVPITVQTTGMGGPSTAIVLEELHTLDSDNWIRIGTCGAVKGVANTKDLVIATGAVPLDGTTNYYLGGKPYAPVPEFKFVRSIVDTVEELNIPYTTGLVASVDVLYDPDPQFATKWAKEGVKAFDMESSTLFYLAAKYRKNSASVMVVSNILDDDPDFSDFISGDDLQEAVDRMVTTVLESIAKMEGK